MTGKASPAFEAVVTVVEKYFDGLHHGDTALLHQVFHPKAQYACATEGTLTHLGMDECFPLSTGARRRPAAARRGSTASSPSSSRAPVTALARVECAIGRKFFGDLPSLVLVDGRWQIIAKVFHFDLREGVR